ncbi:putative pterin-4-alpha-carbinolamine dehydratase [Salinimicrobium marinum]|uniref:Putative pterin-4-alpha-carbinolamine dehydratase n=1 Tax=Salinimicrobium marinum TaxID=680283 RepID=A0A918W2P1_9FLAO|nr:4a-hydroxytetrahydrobiopterin dehydratase [Salinimicrobium marinum]GHA49893.1 putative pterin-4-alpha-carbinolamine dehydratase [Salinimicrobium marinum]
MSKLSEGEIQNRLKELDGWEYKEDAIHTSFEFENFKEAFSVMVRIAFEAEAQQHHPEWRNVYNELTISLSTHDTGGVTEKDFKLARTIEEIVDAG